MPAVKHEPTNTKQIHHNMFAPKDALWKSECAIGDYVSPPSDTAEQAEARVRQHAASMAARASNTQECEQEGGRSVKITTEITDGKFDLLVDQTDEFGDTQYAAANMDYNQLWEHVHNCLDGLERMGRDEKKKPQSHKRWTEVSYDDKGNVSGWTPSTCSCETPWNHLP